MKSAEEYRNLSMAYASGEIKKVAEPARQKKRGRNKRDLPTKGVAKMRLVDKGVGFWTLHQGQWCVRIAGDFKAGDRVRVMANNGNIADAVLGDVVPNTRFQWRNSARDRVDGQLFRRWRLKAGAA